LSVPLDPLTLTLNSLPPPEVSIRMPASAGKLVETTVSLIDQSPASGLAELRILMPYYRAFSR
jgi:hypothetical protein